MRDSMSTVPSSPSSNAKASARALMTMPATSTCPTTCVGRNHSFLALANTARPASAGAASCAAADASLSTLAPAISGYMSTSNETIMARHSQYSESPKANVLATAARTPSLHMENAGGTPGSAGVSTAAHRANTLAHSPAVITPVTLALERPAHRLASCDAVKTPGPRAGGSTGGAGGCGGSSGMASSSSRTMKSTSSRMRSLVSGRSSSTAHLISSVSAATALHSWWYRPRRYSSRRTSALASTRLRCLACDTAFSTTRLIRHLRV
mmetsp:Transcript_7801/g.35407  ORF Transcript_7801/g.35407 Transcript_7801/m.35407 type:complete len:267 (+) Transcript_7801:534-1334(+)